MNKISGTAVMGPWVNHLRSSKVRQSNLTLQPHVLSLLWCDGKKQETPPEGQSLVILRLPLASDKEPLSQTRWKAKTYL